jgi:RimJ/RimL family protein N-acetyltransferase
VLIAGVLYDYWNGSSIYMHVAASGRNWLDREYLHACFDYPFRQLGAKVVIGLVPETNARARRFDEHLGFKLTATIPDGHPEGSLLIYTLRREDCRWVRSEHGQALSATGT